MSFRARMEQSLEEAKGERRAQDYFDRLHQVSRDSEGLYIIRGILDEVQDRYVYRALACRFLERVSDMRTHSESMLYFVLFS